jgi:hypothetical protein
VAGVVVAGAMLWATTAYVAGGHGKGDLAPRQEFEAGRTAALTKVIDRDGPFLLPDASPAHDRDLYIQHLGADESAGWLAIAARAPGQTNRSCFLLWTGRVFRDPCTKRSFPGNGAGLTQYPTRVANHRLYVDLNRNR